MSKSKRVTADKRNEHEIRLRIKQVILKAFVERDMECGFYGLDHPEMVRIAELAASAIMRERKIEVIAKRSE